MTALSPQKNVTPAVEAIEKATIRDRVFERTAPVTDWAAAYLLKDRNATSCIGDLYTGYENYCHRKKCPVLGRKTWFAVMKLSGFETQSGAFTGLRFNGAES
jgi:hypothetical protein